MKELLPAPELPTPQELLRLYRSLSPHERKRRFWTTTPVAEFLRLSPGRVRQLIDEGRVPYFRLRKRHLIDIVTLQKQLERNCE